MSNDRETSMPTSLSTSSRALLVLTAASLLGVGCGEEERPRSPGADWSPPPAPKVPSETSIEKGADGWYQFHTSRGAYQVVFPRKPIYQVQRHPAPEGGTVVSDHAMVEREPPAPSYLVNHVDHSGRVPRYKSAERLLAEVAGNYEKMLVRVIDRRETDISLEGYPGIAVEMQGEALDLSLRSYVVGPHTYTLVTTRPSGGSEANSRRFLDAFRVDDERLEAPMPLELAWTPVREDGFSAEFPGSPGVMEVPPSNEGVGGQQISLQLSKARTFFAIRYLDFADELIAGLTDEQRLEAARDDVLSRLSAKPVGSTRKFEVGGKPGLDFRLESATDTIGRVRLLLVGRRTYEVIGLRPTNLRLGPAVDRFVESFAVSAPAEGAKNASARPDAKPGVTREP